MCKVKPAIIIGCPYGGVEGLATVLRNTTGEDTTIIQVEDIGAVSSEEILLHNGRTCLRDDVISAYVRYPYDLIPPHTTTFVRREKTEFLKSIALLLNPVSVNDVGNAWKMRNRLFSLREAASHGVQTPKSLLSGGRLAEELSFSGTPAQTLAVTAKAIGNCYVAPPDANIGESLRGFVTLAKDGGESAYIFPASRMSEEQVRTYLDTAGYAFLQDAVRPATEYRCYRVGQSTLVYKRDEIDSFDRSAATYRETGYSLRQDTQEGVRDLMASVSFQYLCFDVLVTEQGSEVVIDINPFGSLPPFDRLPAATEQLASLLRRPVDAINPTRK